MATTYPDRQHTLGSLLRLPYQELQGAVYSALAEQGFADLRTAHSAVFRHLDPTGSRMTTLAERAGMTKQSMAYLVESLCESGYLKTVPDPADGRAKLVQLTRRGSKAVATLVDLSFRFESRLAAHLGTAKMARLRGLLEEVADVLESPAFRTADD
jgi:DNA-binding MarR family transcriptional regulator